MEIKFTVPGEPRGKGRPRFSKFGHTYTDSETRAYETKIIAYYRKACGALRLLDTSFLSVDIVAYLPIPKSATKAQRAGMEAGTILPSRKPDVDNIEKAVLDALNGTSDRAFSPILRRLWRMKRTRAREMLISSML